MLFHNFLESCLKRLKLGQWLKLLLQWRPSYSQQHEDDPRSVSLAFFAPLWLLSTHPEETLLIGILCEAATKRPKEPTRQLEKQGAPSSQHLYHEDVGGSEEEDVSALPLGRTENRSSPASTCFYKGISCQNIKKKYLSLDIFISFRTG